MWLFSDISALFLFTFCYVPLTGGDGESEEDTAAFTLEGMRGGLSSKPKEAPVGGGGASKSMMSIRFPVATTLDD